MGTALLARLLGWFIGMSMLQQGISWSINVPKRVTAVEGSCAVVPCQTECHSRVIWYQYHGINYPVVYDGHRPYAVEEQFRGRTSVLGEAAKGNCSLRIDKVKRSDNNLQIYVWIDPESKTTTQKFHHQTVTIVVESTAIEIHMQKRIVNGEMFQANCSVKHSCPFSPPSLHWNKSPFLKDSPPRIFNEHVQGKWWYTETYHGLATSKMHNSKMWCYAKYKTFTKESEQIKLNILYEPVNVTLIQQEEPVIEGGSVSLECAANSNPQPHTYIWLRTQMGQINSTERKRLFSNITRDTSLSCIAYNDIGTRQSEWLDLDVQYAPVILPESSCFLTGKHLKCVCMAEASPSPSINWTIDGNDSLPSSFSFVATNKKNVVSGELSLAAQKPSNIFCTATNSLGSNKKWLSIERSSMYIWLSALMIPGIGLLLGIAMLICRKKSRNRPQTHFMCNTDMALREQSLPGIAEQEERYGNFQRFQDEDILSPCRPDRSCDENTLSAVYDNEFVEERIKTRAQQQQNNKKAY